MQKKNSTTYFCLTKSNRLVADVACHLGLHLTPMCFNSLQTIPHGGILPSSLAFWTESSNGSKNIWNNSRWACKPFQKALGYMYSTCSPTGTKQEFGEGNSLSPQSRPRGQRGILDYDAGRASIKPVAPKGHRHPETDGSHSIRGSEPHILNPHYCPLMSSCITINLILTAIVPPI